MIFYQNFIASTLIDKIQILVMVSPEECSLMRRYLNVIDDYICCSVNCIATRSLLLHSKVRHCQGKHPTHGNRIFITYFCSCKETIEILFAIWEIWLSIYLYETFLRAVCSTFLKRLFSEKVFKHQVIANVIFYKIW